MQIQTQQAGLKFPGDNIRLEHPFTQPMTSAAQKKISQQHRVPESQFAGSSSETVPQQKTLEEGFKDDAVALRERYVLDEVLAVGGSSVIYKARDLRRSFDKTAKAVAIKALRPELRSSTDAIECLQREFRSVAALNHPNIVRVFELEQISGAWFMTMELLEGQSLATLLRDTQPGRLPLQQALAILRACDEALTFAHQHGILHCDFKPGNVWITATQEVRLIDFGAAQICTASANKERVDEKRLPCAATPAYASPQILTGEAPELRDDVFSFACAAYELLAGRHPFGRWNAVEVRSTHALLVRPKGMSLRTRRALVRGLRWQRAQRTASVQALLIELENSFILDNRSAVLEKAVQLILDTRDGFLSLPFAYSKPPQPRLYLEYFQDRFPADGQRLLCAAAITATRRVQSISRLLSESTTSFDSSLLKKIKFKPVELKKLKFDRYKFSEAKAEGKTAVKAMLGYGQRYIRSHSRVTRAVAIRLTRRAEQSFVALGEDISVHLRAVMQRHSRWQARHLIHGHFKPWQVAGVASLLAIALLVFLDQRSAPIAVSDAALAEGVPQSAQIPSRESASNGLSIFETPVDRQANMQSADPSMRSVLPTFHLASSLQNTPSTVGFAFASRPWSAAPVSSAPSRSAMQVAKPVASVTFKDARVDVSDEAIAAVLLLKREGSKRDPVIVHWRTIVGTAKPGADYQGVASGTAKFANNQVVRPLYVELATNHAAQSNRSFEIELNAPSAGASLGQITRTLVTIHKHD